MKSILKDQASTDTIPVMKTAKITKHQAKSDATRTALLQAATTIFARDGYDRAQIDEIAQASGRTRGAVYAQYKTKEQLFFAVQERRIERATQYINELLEKVDPNDFHARWKTIRSAFAALRDGNTEILDLELKLYGLRNPDAIKEWQDKYKRLFSINQFTEFLGLVQKPGRSKLQGRVTALVAIKSGLILAMRFLPEQLPRGEVTKILEEVFEGLFHEDEVVPASSKKARPVKTPKRTKG